MAQTTTQQSDGELATLAAGGNREALAALFLRHHGVIHGYLRARLQDAHLAEDMCQEVFVRLYDAIGRYDASRPFQAWVMGICRNVLREQLRHLQRKREVGWAEMCIELEETGDEQGMYDDMLHLVPRCMSNLNDASTNALKWHYTGGEKLAAIADRLGRSVGAVKVLMVRARQALKRCLRHHLEDDDR